MKKIIKFFVLIAVIAALAFVALCFLKHFGVLKEKEPNIEDYEWKLVLASSFEDSEYPQLHGVEGIGGKDSKFADIKLYAKEGIIYLKKDGEIIAESSIIDGERDENNNYVNNGNYIVDFEGCECSVSVGITKWRDWQPEKGYIDGNLYGKYYLELSVLNSDSRYTMLFFSID